MCVPTVMAGMGSFTAIAGIPCALQLSADQQESVLLTHYCKTKCHYCTVSLNNMSFSLNSTQDDLSITELKLVSCLSCV